MHSSSVSIKLFVASVAIMVVYGSAGSPNKRWLIEGEEILSTFDQPKVDFVLGIIRRLSRIMCSLKCQAYAACMSAFYNSPMKVCILSSAGEQTGELDPFQIGTTEFSYIRSPTHCVCEWGEWGDKFKNGTIQYYWSRNLNCFDYFNVDNLCSDNGKTESWYYRNWYFNTEKLSFDEAQMFCTNLTKNGGLYVPGSLDEINELADLGYLGQSSGLQGRAWIGLSDKLVEGMFVSFENVTNQPQLSDAWCAGQPNNANGGKDCAVIAVCHMGNIAYGLHDYVCDSTQPSVCFLATD